MPAVVTVTLPDKSKERLDALVKVSESSEADVLSNAIRLYEFMIEAITEGTIFTLAKDGKQEPFKPFG